MACRSAPVIGGLGSWFLAASRSPALSLRKLRSSREAAGRACSPASAVSAASRSAASVRFTPTRAPSLSPRRAPLWPALPTPTPQRRPGPLLHECPAAETDVGSLPEISPETIGSYQMVLLTSAKANGEPLSIGTQYHRLTALKSFFRFLLREGKLLTNPASSIVLPKKRRTLPQALVTAKETLQILDTSTPMGLRDRAIVEVLYSTGIRNAELRGLTLADFDAGAETLMIRRGKGGKDRLVPLGPTAAAIVCDYVAQSRPKLAQRDGVHALFLTKNGYAIDALAVRNAVKRSAKAAGRSGTATPRSDLVWTRSKRCSSPVDIGMLKFPILNPRRRARTIAPERRSWDAARAIRPRSFRMRTRRGVRPTPRTS